MKKITLTLSLSLLFLINNSCESANSAPVDIPNFEIECTISSCDSTVAGQGFVFIIKSNCPEIGESAFEPTASGNNTLTCDSSGCTGTITSWRDPNGDPISEIASGSYQICAYIDSNGNLAEDSGEPEYESTISISTSATQILDDWSPAQ